MAVLYEVRRVPVQSGLLAPDAKAAHRYPCGDIRLAFCSECGFISNLLFNTALQDYRPEYENAPHHSFEFSRFTEKLAGQWIDDYAIRNKTILELGCRTDDFLSVLNRLGGNTGVGLDLTCFASRLSGAAKAKVQIVRDEYSSKYGSWKGDVICCRHTLEHVFATGEFIEGLRQFIGDKHDTLLLFGVPDVARTLREQAFWDFNYERCSYFTAGSLAYLFRRNSFDVIDLRREHDDQYLVLAARPSSGPTTRRFDTEDDLEQTITDVVSFQAACAVKARFWQARMRQFLNNGRKVVAWGFGSQCVSFCTTLGIKEELAYAVDTNPHNDGKFLPGSGHRIVGPEYLQREPPDVVVAMNPDFREEIESSLDCLGLHAELLSL